MKVEENSCKTFRHNLQ